jgi:acyl-CoA synthetase (AMP-forming)/AMP-acid ligase II
LPVPAPGDRGAAPPCGLASLADLLHYRAAVQPDERAYLVLSDRGEEEAAITFAELERRARALAGAIAARAAPGERALLLAPNGIEFLVGLFGCLFAGVIAVPLMPPRRSQGRDASAGILADCAPRLALAPRALFDGRGDLARRFAAAGLEWLASDDPAAPPAGAGAPRAGRGEDVAFLQYTSGSTATPKGVMLSHANLFANLEMIGRAFANTGRSTHVSWVPLYHDMGLITNALQTLYLGALCVLLAPVAFVQRPVVWLRAISRYRAEVAGGPNFAFDLCVERVRAEETEGLDLSCWRLAFNGAEPVRAETIRRFAERFSPCGFAPAAMYPAYGMAEASVLIAGGRRGSGPVLRPLGRDALRRHRVAPPGDAADAQTVVGCGRAVAPGRLAIVDPDTAARLGPERVGEIWVAGPNVARGYWRNPAASAAAFGGRIADEDGQWLRTGDLGFVDRAGELFVTGRSKDLVIIRGMNHYPQDIEATVEACHPALRRHGGAAFAVADEAGAERLVIVQEVARSERRRIVPAAIVRRIREAVVGAHEIVPYDIVLLRPGALPLTTSGKIQRGLSRQMWQEGALQRLR